ncbi:hypothetical protein MAR_036761 [Mya arenaria]|uniref:Uncharacterized protein n=1 Tax=Mya arenaria TaxID=6604 RepID=A0ABY7FLT2_MYAAR|nr:hypothetical protein MAR_036761 [Mya arenaria]
MSETTQMCEAHSMKKLQMLPRNLIELVRSSVVTRPRGAGRQNHRATQDVDTVADYWRITLFNVVLDHLIQEMETRILSNEHRFATQYLLPNRLPGLQDGMTPTIYAAYGPYLQH